MRRYCLIFLIPLALAACTDKPLITMADKARFTEELISERADCKVFSEQLTPPLTDAKQINQIYQAAKTAHCLKPTV